MAKETGNGQARSLTLADGTPVTQIKMPEGSQRREPTGSRARDCARRRGLLPFPLEIQAVLRSTGSATCALLARGSQTPRVPPKPLASEVVEFQQRQLPH